MNWTGVYTAIVTPFTEAGEVDVDALGRLLDAQIAAGVDGVVPVGTTGESPTLTMKEHQQVIEFTIRHMAGKGRVIAGTGANSTAEALELTAHAKEAGADATLQVTPYYNKPSQAGLIGHFSAVADLGLPVVLYNVPGRTSREISLETVVELSAHPAIVAVKEATGDVERVSAYADACDIVILSGDDSTTLPMMVVGAVGVISVAANVMPRGVREMVHAALAGDWPAAQALHHKLYPLFRDLFIDTNPVPVKAALAMMGHLPEIYRRPLCSMTATAKAQLRKTLVGLGLV
jgi:4-hydroxy-tetrahydrodipicolinate synthase